MKAKILVVEDYDELREEIVDSLTDEDYEVSSKANAADGIEAARWAQFDLLITDVRLPGTQDGIDGLEGIKKLLPKIYTIVITGYTDDNAPSRAMRHGVDFYLYKPFGIAKLINVVDTVLATQRDHSTYQHQLAKFFQGPRRLLAGLAGKSEQPELILDPARITFFKALYAGMQSKNLTVTGSLSLWDELQPLEQAYEALQNITGPGAEELARKYQLLQARAEKMAQSRTTGDPKPREPGQMVMAFFSKLYQRAVDGAFGVPILMAAPALWARANQRRPEGEMGNIWDRIFGT